MGDRIIFQVISKGEFSPAIYGHWSGGEASEVCQRLAERMKGRTDDVGYTAARCAQELIQAAHGNAGYGMWNADKVLTAEDSQGDAGVVLIDCSAEKLKFECLGGYLLVGADGFPRERKPSEG